MAMALASGLQNFDKLPQGISMIFTGHSDGFAWNYTSYPIYGGATTLDGLLLLHLHNLLPVGIGPLLVSSSLAELPHWHAVFPVTGWMVVGMSLGYPHIH